MNERRSTDTDVVGPASTPEVMGRDVDPMVALREMVERIGPEELASHRDALAELEQKVAQADHYAARMRALLEKSLPVQPSE